MSISPLHERIFAVVGDRTYRSVGDLTGHVPETVRRYMNGAAPSVEFLSALCQAFDLNAHWLLTGQGPMRASEQTRHALKEANPGELLAAVADALEKLTERVDRIERFVQTLETELRAVRSADKDMDGGQETSEEQGQASRTGRGFRASDRRPGAGAAGSFPGDAGRFGRARSVADALAERSSEDVD
jgi:hypothetical protein